ncbi:SLOG family protein [Streptomyces zhihengii]
MKAYRVLVTGSRDWPTPDLVWGALNDVRDEALTTDRHLILVHGACPRGADAHAHQWATTATQFVNGITEEQHPADWSLHRRAAGFIRNAHMVNLGADVLLAFIKDQSRGATHTTRLAHAAGIPVRRWTA